MNRARALGVYLLFFVSILPAQRPFPGAIDIDHSLRKLDELGTVLHICAHPDDERTNVLAYFARGRHMRTAYLSLTRGEGGQNLIGSEQGPQLGVIRTQELLDARQIDGAEQFFTRAIDFGFTRTFEESMAKWGHDRILSDVVWIVRRYRPDVIILGFSGTPADGHGQHQASAILGKEAFTAAADPKRFPEQLKYVQPWQAKRLAQAQGFGPPNGKESGPRAGTGDFNPVLGYSYEEIAVLSRSMHHSQGTGAMRRPDGSPHIFTIIGGAPAANDLFDGIDTTWNRLPGGAPVGVLLDDAVRAFTPEHPEKAIPFLVKARPLIAAINDPLAKEKLAELDEALAKCTGLWAEAQSRQPEIAPGTDFAVTTTLVNRSSARVTFESARMEGLFNQDLKAQPTALAYNKALNIEFSQPVPPTQAYTQPYWLAKPPTADVYRVDDQMLIGLADSPPAAKVRIRLTIDGGPVEIVRPVHFRYAERALGERVRPTVIVPAVAVNLPERVALFPDSAPRKVQVSVQADIANPEGELRLDLPAGWKATPPSQSFKLDHPGEQEVVTFTVTPPAGETTASMQAVARVGGREMSSGMQVIAYPHIPTQVLFPPANIKLVRSNIRITAKKIGYIMGAGDDVPDALRQFGLDVTLLNQSDLEQGDLSRFDCIVAGVRSYNVRPDLRANQSRLMDYVRNGGTYIVQYQTGDSPDPNTKPNPNQPTPPASLTFGLNTTSVTSNLGPYPFAVPFGNKYRVTVEESPVKFTNPDSPLLQSPNRITSRDFEGWVQERGVSFAATWDPRYQTVISTGDPGEEALAGGEIWTRYGKGVYIFTAFGWFRQLPAGVPGAWRLFANMLSAK